MADYTKPLPIPDLDSTAILGPMQSARACGAALRRLWKIPLATPSFLSALLFLEIRVDEARRNRHRIFFRGRALRVDSCF